MGGDWNYETHSKNKKEIKEIKKKFKLARSIDR